MLGLGTLTFYARCLGMAYAALALVSVVVFGAETEVGQSDAGDDVFSGSGTWDADGATFYWDFSKADNYDYPSSATSNFDVWNIGTLAKNGGNLTISFQGQESGFGTGNLTGDYKDQMNYSTLTPGYWFNDVVTVNALGDTFSSGDVVLANTPGSGTWSAWVEDGGTSVSLRYDGSFPAGYSAVPEPSTYVMVSGLLAMPLWRILLRFRKGKKEV